MDSPDTYEQITSNRSKDINERMRTYNHIIDICRYHQLISERVRWTNGIPGQDMLSVTLIAE